MADIMHEMTDKKLAEMEKRLSAIYSRANEEIGIKWKEYLEKSNEKIDVLQKAYDEAKKSGDSKLIKETGYKLGRAKQEQTILNRRFKDLTAQTAAELSHINETALAYINNQLPTIYTLNYNALAASVNGFEGYSFMLTDASTVKYLAEADRNLLPYKKINGKKDVRWNIEKLNAEVLQGILQGEAMDDIAKRFRNVTKMDEISAIRNARTTVTAAENKGRQDSYERARDDGIDIKKQWMSTLDMRTRHSHALLDGETVEIDKPFKTVLDDGTPTEIMYPADPNAVPEMVYNCRCTTIADVGQEKIRSHKVIDDNGNETLIENLTYEEWYKWKTGKPFAIESDYYINQIRNSKIFEGLDDSKKNAIIKALENGDKEHLRMFAESSKYCNVDWITDSTGTSFYRFGTGHITMYGEDDDEYFAEIFLHEYGHFIDDAKISKTGVNIVETHKYKSGREYVFNWEGTTEVAQHIGYYEAAEKDVNAFLKKAGLSDKYKMYREDEYSVPWMHRVSDGSSLDLSIDFEDMSELEKALSAKFEVISGKSKLYSFWDDAGMPKRPEYSDYFETYTTPKRKLIRTREKYKGAGEAYHEDLIRAEEAREIFEKTHDMESLYEKYSQIQKQVDMNEMMLGFVSDTFDGATNGAFLSHIKLGGHSAEYYISDNHGIKEGAANVFAAVVSNNEMMDKGFSEICPEIFRVLKEALTYGRK